jgi:hypothetical protein
MSRVIINLRKTHSETKTKHVTNCSTGLDCCSIGSEKVYWYCLVYHLYRSSVILGLKFLHCIFFSLQRVYIGILSITKEPKSYKKTKQHNRRLIKLTDKKESYQYTVTKNPFRNFPKHKVPTFTICSKTCESSAKALYCINIVFLPYLSISHPPEMAPIAFPT